MKLRRATCSGHAAICNAKRLSNREKQLRAVSFSHHANKRAWRFARQA